MELRLHEAEPPFLSPANKFKSLIGVLLAAAYLPLLFPQVQQVHAAFYAIAIGNTALAIALLAIFIRNPSLLARGIAGFEVKKTHLVQALVQSSVYFYWGHYYFGVAERAPLIIHQLLFAYLFHICVSLITRGRFVFNLSIFPIVLSINFFIWFQPQFFWAQLAMVAAGILGKAFLTRTIDGQRRHIFNPSGLAMALVAWGAIVFGFQNTLQTVDIIESYDLVPHFFLYILAVGSLSLWAGRVALITFGSVATMIGADMLCRAIFGTPLLISVIHQNLFLAMTLLITDPVTSPKSKPGQFLYGAAYAGSIIFAYGLLSWLQQPVYFDKILFVPLLNFLTPVFDKIRIQISRERRNPAGESPLYLVLYGLFLLPQIHYLDKHVYQMPHLLFHLGGDIPADRMKDRAMTSADPKLQALVTAGFPRKCSEDIQTPLCPDLTQASH